MLGAAADRPFPDDKGFAAVANGFTDKPLPPKGLLGKLVPESPLPPAKFAGANGFSVPELPSVNLFTLAVLSVAAKVGGLNMSDLLLLPNVKLKLGLSLD